MLYFCIYNFKSSDGHDSKINEVILNIFDFKQGTSPLLMSIPHVGENIPNDIVDNLMPIGKSIPDTDWYLDRLYDFASDLGASILRANYSRYVIDLNRAPDSRALYPGANNTELVPTSTFLEYPLYETAKIPDADEIARRKKIYWAPYHKCIRDTVSELRDYFGHCVLFDCHSIKSVLPRFFEGKLSDFNLGTAEGRACDIELQQLLSDTLSKYSNYSLAINDRFKGGYITRQYGNPQEGVHAFQLELSTATYMDENPDFKWREDLADLVRPSLKHMMQVALNWRPRTINRI